MHLLRYSQTLSIFSAFIAASCLAAWAVEASPKNSRFPTFRLTQKLAQSLVPFVYLTQIKENCDLISEKKLLEQKLEQLTNQIDDTCKRERDNSNDFKLQIKEQANAMREQSNRFEEQINQLKKSD